MKITLIVFLSVITLVACSIPAPFKSSKTSKPKGKNCVCREKECTDVSCEEKNCLCVVKAVKQLQNNKDAKYPKKWLAAYLQFVQERCLCINGCQKICSPTEFIECSSAAYDRFLCKYQTWVDGVINDKGFDLFNEDIKRLNAECINKDCKPICSGNGDCNPFYVRPKDCGCTKGCVIKLVKSIAALLKDREVKDELEEFEIFLSPYYDSLLSCYHLTNPKSQAACIDAAHDEIDRALKNLFESLVRIAGPCTAISILSTIKQGAIECAYKKK